MIPKGKSVRLLPRKFIITTGGVDHASWNFHPLLGLIQRKRFEIAVKLLSNRRYGRLLEIGYGSGVFMPELALHCENLYGLDPHPKKKEVEAILERQGLDVSLTTGTAESIPFEDSFFDAVVAISTMEYVPEIDAACVEIGRVLNSEGVFVLVTPGYSKFLDLVVRALTGESAEEQYGDRRQRLMDAIQRHFVVSEMETHSPFLIPLIRVYTALKLRRMDGG